MKLPEIKGIIRKVHPKESIGEKGSTKQTFELLIAGRTYDDGFGGVKKLDDEVFEMDVINGKVPSDFLLSLVDKKVVVEQSYLNSYEFDDKDTKEKRLGKSITVVKLKEFKQ